MRDIYGIILIVFFNTLEIVENVENRKTFKKFSIEWTRLKCRDL